MDEPPLCCELGLCEPGICEPGLCELWLGELGLWELGLRELGLWELGGLELGELGEGMPGELGGGCWLLFEQPVRISALSASIQGADERIFMVRGSIRRQPHAPQGARTGFSQRC